MYILLGLLHYPITTFANNSFSTIEFCQREIKTISSLFNWYQLTAIWYHVFTVKWTSFILSYLTLSLEFLESYSEFKNSAVLVPNGVGTGTSFPSLSSLHDTYILSILTWLRADSAETRASHLSQPWSRSDSAETPKSRPSRTRDKPKLARDSAEIRLWKEKKWNLPV